MEIGHFQPYFGPHSWVLLMKNLKKIFSAYFNLKNQKKNKFLPTGHFTRFPALGAYDAPMPACS